MLIPNKITIANTNLLILLPFYCVNTYYIYSTIHCRCHHHLATTILTHSHSVHCIHNSIILKLIFCELFPSAKLLCFLHINNPDCVVFHIPIIRYNNSIFAIFDPYSVNFLFVNHKKTKKMAFLIIYYYLCFVYLKSMCCQYYK